MLELESLFRNRLMFEYNVAMGLDWTISLIPLLGILSSYRT
jgi:hypothetical protein